MNRCGRRHPLGQLVRETGVERIDAIPLQESLLDPKILLSTSRFYQPAGQPRETRRTNGKSRNEGRERQRIRLTKVSEAISLLTKLKISCQELV